MSAPWRGSMKGPPLKIPLLLLLLLLSALTRTVFCQNEEDVTEAEADAVTEATAASTLVEGGDAQTSYGDASDTLAGEMPPVDPETSPSTDQSPEQPPTGNGVQDETNSGVTTTTTESLNSHNTSEMGDPKSTTNPEIEVLNPIIILIPVALVLLIISMIVLGIFISRRWKKQTRHQELRKEDPYLDSPSEEKVPMPMFEEDVPSVLELEMEELDQWMKKDSENSGDSTHT